MKPEAILKKVSISRIAFGGIYLFAVIIMLVKFSDFKIPHYGYTWLPQFGSYFHSAKSETFKSTTHLITSEWGYDGQFYAQMAVDPFLKDTETLGAFDNFIFRTRRLLFSLIPFAIGGGDPQAALNVYCVQNIFFWLGTSVLLLRWLPPYSLQNTFRYVAILYTSGLVSSITNALLDGPALLLVILALFLYDCKAKIASNIALGLAGLGKETSVFAAIHNGIPSLTKPLEIAKTIGYLSIVAAPVFVWLAYLGTINPPGASQSLGTSNFNWPGFGWWNAVHSLFEKANETGWNANRLTTAGFLIAMPIQAISMILIFDFKNAWWRVGMVFAIFTIILGDQVWVGLVGSAARVVLPLTVAFNLIAPRKKRWLPILLAGNLLTLAGIYQLDRVNPPASQLLISSDYSGSIDLGSDGYPSMQWTDGWFPQERLGNDHWRWSSGKSTITINSTAQRPAVAIISFKTRSIAERSVDILANGKTIATFDSPLDPTPVLYIEIPIRRGSNIIEFRSDTPPSRIPSDPRDLAFMIFNPTIRLE